jgi:fluoride exporter
MESLPQVFAVALGAAFGALLRWGLSLWLNPQWNGFPLGTLFVNCTGGLLIGVAMVGLTRAPNELLRLLLVTGFLGGMTTFSAFSAESLELVQRGQWALALGHTLAHVLGALVCAGLGFAIARVIWRV